MRNRLVVIGWIGVRVAYLNIPREEAIRRFNRDHGGTGEEPVEEIGFADEFGAYEVWGP